MPLLVNGEPYIHGLDPDVDEALRRLGNTTPTTDLLAHQQNTDRGTNRAFFEVGILSPFAAAGPLRRGFVFDTGGAGPSVALAWEVRDKDGTATGRFVQCLDVIGLDPANPLNDWQPFGFATIPANTVGQHPEIASAREGIIYLLGRLTSTTPPVIGGFTPASGLVGSLVLINGNNFGSATGAVLLGTKTCTVEGWSNFQISLRVPVGATDGKFTVTTAGGQDVSRDTFTVTSALVLSKPGPISGLRAVVGNGYIGLVWTGATDDGNSPITDHQIRYRLAGGLWAVYTHSPRAATNQSVGGLTNNERYEFTAAAVNAQGVGPESPIVSETPVGTAVVTPTVYNASYATTPEDYAAKCGVGTTGASVTASGSGSTQAAADANAKANAIAGITCSVAPATYANTLSISTQIGPDGFSFVPAGAETFEYNALTTPTSGPIVSVSIVSGGFTCYCDYNNEDAGRPFRFTNRAGVSFTGTVPASDTTLTF